MIQNKLYTETQESFRNVRQQLLLNQLTNNYLHPKNTFSSEDLNVDLVIRLRVPQNKPYDKIDYDQVQFTSIFKNAPHYFAETYQTVEEYISFLVEKVKLQNHETQPSRRMLSLAYLPQPRIKIRELVDIFGEDQIAITCQTQYLSEMDTFTLKYSMLIIVLQQLCGFHIKSYLFENEQDEGYEGQFVIYLLMSQSIENLMKLADRHRIKKEINMVHIDFSFNDPVDSTNRPLKLNKYFRTNKKDEDEYLANQKTLMRILGVKEMNLQAQIIEECQISKDQAEKFQRYNQQLFAELANILNTDPVKITNNERKYVYYHNRYSLNEGTLSFLYQKKLREKMYQKIMNINREYGYSENVYSDTFVSYKIPSRNKSYFDKLGQLLIYKPSICSPYGELTLFNRMQRIKLAYASLEEYLKIQHFHRIGASVYAINNDFQRFGRITYQYDANAEDQSELIEKGGLNGFRLKDVWSSTFPFSSKIRHIRDYLGQSLAFQILIKIRMLAFLFCSIPLSVLAEYINQAYFTNHTVTYKFGLFQLAVMVISLTIFIEIWTKEQDIFFNNYVTVNQKKTFRSQYQGPYYRNIVSDEPSQFLTQIDFAYRCFNFLAYIIICTMLILEGLFFWGMRFLILYLYQHLPVLSWNYLPLSHLIGYSIFFLVNFLLFTLLIQKIIIKIVDWHCIATKQDYQLKIRSFTYMFILGIQVIGPLFLYVIEPFRGVSCYNAECVDEFTIYAYSRFYIIFFIILFRLGKLLKRTIMGDLNLQPLQKLRLHFFKMDSYISKLNYLLKFVKDQYKKEEIAYDIKEESMLLYYYCIFSINFPFCTVLAFFYLYIGYLLARIYVFRYSRRPLPLGQNLFKLAGTYELIKHCCIIFNTWSLFFIYQLFEYELSNILLIFTDKLSKHSILTFKIVATSIGVIIYQLISYFTKNIVAFLINDWKQKRKVTMYRKYLIKSISIVDKTVDRMVVTPIRTIFRTFTHEAALLHKKNHSKLFQKTFRNKQKKYQYSPNMERTMDNLNMTRNSSKGFGQIEERWIEIKLQ